MFRCRRSVRRRLLSNIFVIHAFGDVQAFWLLGYIGGHTNMHVAFLFVSGMIFASGLAWLIGAKYLPADTAAVETAVIRLTRISLESALSILRHLSICLLISLASSAYAAKEFRRIVHNLLLPWLRRGTQRGENYDYLRDRPAEIGKP